MTTRSVPCIARRDDAENVAALAATLNDAAPAPSLCAVCYDQPRSVVLTACGHALLCQPCLERVLMADVPKCPLCATPVPPVPGAWRSLVAASALAPAATYMPTAVDPAVASAALSVRQPDASDELALLRAAVQRGVAPAGALLSRAVLLGAENVVRLLVLERGAEPNTPDESGRLPLACAATAGQADCVRALVELGADVTCASNEGATPLHCAAQNGHADCVRALVELGADVACANNDGAKPLHFAAQNGQADCVRALVELGHT